MMAQVLALFPNARIDHYCGPREVACYLDLGQINVRLSFDGRVHNEVFVLPWNSRGDLPIAFRKIWDPLDKSINPHKITAVLYSFADLMDRLEQTKELNL